MKTIYEVWNRSLKYKTLSEGYWMIFNEVIIREYRGPKKIIELQIQNQEPHKRKSFSLIKIYRCLFCQRQLILHYKKNFPNYCNIYGFLIPSKLIPKIFVIISSKFNPNEVKFCNNHCKEEYKQLNQDNII